MFDLKRAIHTWKRNLRSNPSFEDGDVAELESHLCDEIERLKAKGLSEEEAFVKATKEIGKLDDIGNELYKNRTTKIHATPEWIQRSWISSLVLNYFKISFRSLKHRKGYSFINIFGLAVGLLACILIGLYIQDELSYDNFHTNAERTYRVLREIDTPNQHTTISNTPPALVMALKEGVPNIDEVIRIARTSTKLQYGFQTNVVPTVVFAPGEMSGPQPDIQKFTESGFVWADPGFFEVFSFPILSGEAALSRPGTVILSKDMVTKYFPNINPVGRTLQVGDKTLEVTGVMENIPDNSHLNYIDFVGSMETLDFESGSWGYNNFKTYIVLAKGTLKSDIARQVNEIIKAGIPEYTRPGENYFIPHLQPITGIHLGQGVDVDIESTGNILHVYIFGALAVLIMLLSCINFMNLSTARSWERAKEVGIRKTFGAGRKQLIKQFLSESILMSFVALSLALILCYYTLPLLNQLAAKSISFGTIFGETQLLTLVALTILVGLLAGSYPAFLLSGFQPMQVLKSTIKTKYKSRLREGLVVFQFGISIAILVCTGIVYQQLNFIRSTDLGFDDKNLITIENIDYLDTQLETFMQELRKLPAVQDVTSGYSMPGTLFFNGMWGPVQPDADRQNVNFSYVDWDYFEALDINLVAGRDFTRERASDSTAVILNESAVRKFGWKPEEAIGKNITMHPQFEYTIIGVSEDFHYASLHTEIHPLILFPPFREQNRIAIRLQPDNPAKTIEAIRDTWEKFSNLSFSYSFLDENLEAQYHSDQRLARVFGYFAVLAIIIACLGLFSLAAYTAQQRTKEIGIRKVIGATISNIVGLLSKDFLKLVLFGFLIAVPVSWYMMRTWLQNFAYKIEIGPSVFLMAGGFVLLIALITVSYQSAKAALANPVESLRSE